MSLNPASGLAYVFQGGRLIVRPALLPFVLVPLVINIAVFGAGIWYGYGYLGVMSTWLQGHLPDWLDWLTVLLLPLFVIVCLLVVFFVFTMLANLIASPFNGLLAEKVEEYLTGMPVADGGWGKLVRELPLTLWDEIKKVAYFLLWAVPVLLLFLIPGINAVAPVIWMALSAWFMAVQYADYPLGNHGLRGKEIRRRLASDRFTALGFGAGVLFLTTLPVVNFIAMPLAVAGATALWVERMKEADS